MPSWTLLAFMYWNIALPHKVSVGTGFITGLLFDTLIGSTLGQNALTPQKLSRLAAGLFCSVVFSHHEALVTVD